VKASPFSCALVSSEDNVQGCSTSSTVGLDDFDGWSLVYTVGWIDSVGLPLGEIDGLAESVGLLLHFTFGLIRDTEDAVLFRCEKAEGEFDGRSVIQTSSRNSSGAIASRIVLVVPPNIIALLSHGVLTFIALKCAS
jgi:hypothetical protein